MIDVVDDSYSGLIVTATVVTNDIVVDGSDC